LKKKVVSERWKCIAIVVIIISCVGIIIDFNDLNEIRRLDENLSFLSKKLVNVSTNYEVERLSEGLIDLKSSIEDRRILNYYHSIIWLLLSGVSVLGISYISIHNKIKEMILDQVETTIHHNTRELEKYLEKENNMRKFKNNNVSIHLFSDIRDSDDELTKLLNNDGYRTIYQYDFVELCEREITNDGRSKIIFINNENNKFTNPLHEISLEKIQDIVDKKFKDQKDLMCFYYCTKGKNFYSEIKNINHANQFSNITSNLNQLVESYLLIKEK
jgi:hypothetical protein